MNDHTDNTRYVRVRIGPDGNIMPGEAWQVTHPAHCVVDAMTFDADGKSFDRKTYHGSGDVVAAG